MIIHIQQLKIKYRHIAVFIAVIVFVTLLISYLLAKWLTLPIENLLIPVFVITLLSSEINRRISLYINKKNKSTSKIRISLLISLYTLSTLTLVVFTGLLFHYIAFEIFQGLSFSKLFIIFGIPASICSVTGLLFEFKHLLKQWKQNVIAAERSKIENLQTQLDSLKKQVNPHFLFNSLNALLALIDEDREKAGKFVQEMSQVYRYLLQTNEKPLIALRQELAFIESYFFLLKTRFNNNLTYSITAEKNHLNYTLAPLTLQLLVENAIKHNVVSSGKPLHINITINQNNELIVTNNLQLKRQTTPFSKTDISNISIKYKLLNLPGIKINQLNDIFEVRIPLVDELQPAYAIEI